MKKILIAGNWKMNTHYRESVKLAEDIHKGLVAKELKSEVLVCPPFTSLYTVCETLKGGAVMCGAQNCHFEAKGAYTGEVSLQMIKVLGCSHVIIGHSERREYFGETDEIVNKKASAALANGIYPIVCIGETLDERQSGETYKVLGRQISAGLQNIAAEDAEKVIIAYEPVWAIGTGLAATAEQAQEAHAYIRARLAELFGEASEDMAILYGGSMTPENAASLLALKDVNGGLVGGASLKAESFLAIIGAAEIALDN